MWLKDTATVMDPAGNPWKCECTALGEAWWEMRHLHQVLREAERF